MKYFLVLSLFIGAFSNAQNYQLLPDTCTACSYQYTMGTSEVYEGVYYLNPENDTNYLGNSYIRLQNIWGSDVLGFRQSGNKVLGIVSDSTQEYVFQDWEVSIGDTVFNLFSNGTFYDAIFMIEDSILLNDSTYHHTRGMQGIGFYGFNGYETASWDINWHERGLCAGTGLPNALNTSWRFGGIQYNLFDYPCLCGVYANPKPHTLDPRYNLSALMGSCIYYGTNDVTELKKQVLIIHPNPTIGLIDITEFGPDLEKIQVIDIKGQLIIDQNLDTPIIDIQSFDNGIYLLLIHGRDGIVHQAKINLSK